MNQKKEQDKNENAKANGRDKNWRHNLYEIIFEARHTGR